MKKFMILLLIVSFFFIAPFTYGGETTEKALKIKIPERTVIPVRLIQHLKGGDSMVGQSVDFEVATDIIIDNFVVIKYKAPAYATVTAAEKAGYVSQGGKIGLSMDYAKAVDGSKVYLKSILGEQAEDHMGANIAASIIICPLILAVKGDEAEIPPGREFKAYVQNDVDIEVLASAKMSDSEMQLIEQKQREERERIERERIEKEKKEKEKAKSEWEQRGAPIDTED